MAYTWHCAADPVADLFTLADEPDEPPTPSDEARD